MTRDRSLEATVLLQDILIVLAAMMLSRGAHALLVNLVPTLKPPVAAGDYAHLLLVFLPTWIFAADRLGIHRLRTLTGGKLEIARRVILTQAWGIAAIGLILTFAQVSLNRSLIIVFLALSTTMLLVAKALQAPWLERRRGQSRVLLIGDAPAEVAGEFERLRGRHVERWTGDDVAGLKARFRTGAVDEVVLSGRLPPDQLAAFVGACAEAGLPVFIPIPLEPQALPLPAPEVETVGNNDYVVYQPRKLDSGVLAAKAIADRVLAAVLIVLFAPIMLLVALAVLISVGRPVLFVQRRAGLYGHPFPMLKFRTMHAGADAKRAALGVLNEMDGPVFKMRDDPRVTAHRTDPAPHQPRRAAAAVQRAGRPDEHRRAAAAAARRDPGADRPPPPPPVDPPGAHLSVAGERAQRSDVRGVDGAGPRIRRQLDAVAGPRDPAAHHPGDRQPPRRAVAAQKFTCAGGHLWCVVHRPHQR